MTNHRLLLDKTNKWEQLLQLPHRYVPFGNQHWSVSTTIHVQPSTFGGCFQYRCEATLATTKLHWFASITMEVLHFEFSFVFIVFCNIPQTTEYLLLYFVAFIPQE